jgi:hypothetical protein
MNLKYPLQRIRPEDVDFAEFNPRGEKPEDIESDPEFEQLKDSVFKYGVLVPIVVHEQKAGKPYRLVDGERRLRAALATKTPMIPAHIAAGESELDDLVQAFHIHMLRKQWRAVARARALRKIMDKLEEEGKVPRASALMEELRVSTGCTPSQLKALRRAIVFPASALKAVDEGTLSWSHLIQIEESFTEALREKFPDLLTEIGAKYARKVLVKKAQQKILTSTRALMENVLPVITLPTTEEEKQCAKKLLKGFIFHPAMPAEQVLEEYERAFPASGKNWAELGNDILGCADRMSEMLDRVGTEMVRGHPKLTRDLQENLHVLGGKIDAVLRRIRRVTE